MIDLMYLYMDEVFKAIDENFTIVDPRYVQ